ncbi:MAG: hypothetical protein CTY34_12105 [Methylobacter sp.]|nr:MAG: hypothetical protein CTY34_12105 [Methylobacter sp.]PPD35989.1 MAG: hypothetical protein CTY18_05795 [Methylomonas sp.]
MKTKQVITLDDAKRVAAAARAEAAGNHWDVVIAIVDEGGHLKYFEREDAMIGSIEVAIAKAKSALLFRRPSKLWEDKVVAGNSGCLSMPGVLATEGGLPLIIGDDVVGAIGVSGVKSSEDGQVAAAGAKAL